MSYVLCNISAFRYHRVPPQVLALCPPIPDPAGDLQRRALRASPFATEVLGLPLHTLATGRDLRSRGALTQSHLWTGDMPVGGIWDTELGFRVTSPLFTLLTLAPSVSETHLLMMAYEMCGLFSVYRPSDLIEEALKGTYSSGDLSQSFGWLRATDYRGKPSSLWIRHPLFAIEDLRKFAEDHKSSRGGKKLLWVAHTITGITASPLEVQASILFSLPRNKGGEGLRSFENNCQIDLNRSAQRIAGKGKVYADLRFVSKDQMSSVIVECQGLSVHGCTGVLGEDANRATALQTMGYDVVLLTYAQIQDRERFASVSQMLHRRLEYPVREKSERMRRKEADLRHELFIDWETLGR